MTDEQRQELIRLPQQGEDIAPELARGEVWTLAEVWRERGL